ncbi:hypothetical protein [Parabacteroides chinchillae]
MDNAGDWIYIVFLIIAGVSGLLSSGKKKKQSKNILGRPGNDIPEDSELSQEKGFWEILQEMQEEKPQPTAPDQPQTVIKNRANKQQQFSQPTKTTVHPPFLSGENIPESTKATPISILQQEEENGIIPEQTFTDMAELRKAIICSEILNRKY